MLFGILLTIQIIIGVSMGGLILVQRSEGGALGMGGGPSGFMSARGAGNLLTKATAILAFLFFANCIGLTIVGNIQHRATSAIDKVDTSGLTLKPTQTAPAAEGAASSSKAPSLSDLPLVSNTPAAPASTAPKPAASSLPALPAALPAAAPQKDINKAKAGIWASSASASSSAAKP